LIREIFRQYFPVDGEPPLDVVVIPKREMLDATFSDLAEDFRNGLRRGAGRLEKYARK
jgi:RNase P protein component